MRQVSGGPRTPTKTAKSSLPLHPPSTPPELVLTLRSPRQVVHTVARMHDDIMFPILETSTRVRIWKLEKAVEMSFAERSLLRPNLLSKDFLC